MNKFNEFRTKYSSFIYDDYKVVVDDNAFVITYNYEIPGLDSFNHKIVIPKKIITRKIDNDFLNNLIFHLGLVEAISYYKCCCPYNFIIKCGSLNSFQINWFKKLYYNGLGEFIYRNNIDISMSNFVNFVIDNNLPIIDKKSFSSIGNMIAIGGGKDSCVSLELLKGEDNACFLINGKGPMIDCVETAGYDISSQFLVERILDKDKLINLNKNGYLNGHIPLNAAIAFLSYLTAYLTGKKYIILSNECSANESYVKGLNVNHQYSKSFEFENDFYNYSLKYFSDDIIYFSLLRPLSELQIAFLFSKYNKYHKVFKSCNLGSKNDNWQWCLNCSKCLFIYIILSAFLSSDEMLEIFGDDLFNKESMLDDFIGLIGKGDTKPFECVGTYSEVLYCVNKIIKDKLDNNLELPFLLKYYYDRYGYNAYDESVLSEYNNENNLNEHFSNIVKEELKKWIMK